MKIEQKLYLLGSASGKALAETDNLLLAINGKPTTVSAREFFSSFEQSDESIKGHSILGEFPIVDNRIQISEDMNVSFWNKNQDEEILLTRYKFPLFQWSDKEIDGESLLEKIKSLMEFKEEEIKVEIEDNEINISQEENPLSEETTEEEEAQSLENEESNELVENCIPYEKEKVVMIERGWKEFSAENFRLLLLPGEKPKVLILLLVDSETYQNVEFSVLNKDTTKESFKFALIGGGLLSLNDNKLTFESE